MSEKSINIKTEGFICPLPNTDYDTIQTAHGSGGKLMSDLIDKIFVKCFDNDIIKKMEDQARFGVDGKDVVFTTDSFVVDPIFFPGGNIGDLAVNGTVNDLCMSGAKALYLSCGFILEEGLPIKDLHKIVVSMRNAADKAGVKIITGDTKVVDRGSCDKIFINTSGVGIIDKNITVSVSNLKPGDKIILSGTIADHGVAIMMCREGLSFESSIKSDSASLNGLVNIIMNSGAEYVHAMRDPTRGGVAATLTEFAKQSNVGIKINNNSIPVKPEVNSACEILGLDPLFIANEGKLITVVDSLIAEVILENMKKHPLGRYAAIIGEVVDSHHKMVLNKNELGIEQILTMPYGEQLPRIC
ncbi:MAG: hydrogenase expression/formation protein HypE [Ignavibacteria bacterium]|jgi:hydrogenase expression/formation protein HypE